MTLIAVKGSAESESSVDEPGCSSLPEIPDQESVLTELEQCYEDKYQDLLTYARWLVKDHATAEDFLQQVFMNTIEAIYKGRDIKNMGAWLRRCIFNLYLYHRRQSSAAPVEGDVDDLPSNEGGGFEVREDVREALVLVDGLPGHYRDAFMMASFQGLSYQEIAKEMDRSVGAVSQLIRRARGHIGAKNNQSS